MKEKSRECKHCGGKGRCICFECYGSGFVPLLDDTPLPMDGKMGKCVECEGTGSVECLYCKGTGQQQV